ncbi:LysR family transcriptional regulator [Aidingimonas halophila]|uniref:DNA-binding transcriptional regulator, LysR family n=1 Tax=Aidingimonas halophila TaxID=574349 RepID=A0A1H2SQG7_9GAMM|nr:LysR family transcriptional regulator [Aidingimonas halophila]GHC17295.1 LysR family transcriptional regulator [Aidingimonas halophila]SDW33828.1 DNA-binding transcriptional regulator, LysR family [Aidingimonas halophila]
MADLDDLAFFQRLAQHGSLTATARELGLSLSAVSKRLKLLEARLGVELAHRTTRRLTLTPEGELYRERGAVILDELDDLEEALGNRRSDLSGRLRINATFGFGRRHIAPILSAFCADHPQLDAWLELTNFPLNLSDHGFDVGIIVGDPPDSRLVAHRLMVNRRILCAAPSYCATMPSLDEPADLSRHQCLVVRENDSDYATWRFEHRSRHDERTVKVSGRLASNDGESMTRMAVDGHGILLRSWWDVHDHLQAGRLIEVLPEWQGVRADFHAVYDQRRHVPARIRAFIAYLEDRIAERVPPLATGGTLPAWEGPTIQGENDMGLSSRMGANT